MKSIISNERECFVCKKPFHLHRHHIWGGGRRELSEKYGCWVYLCGRHHNFSDFGVHYNKSLDIKLKKLCQTKLEESGWSREKVAETFGRNYLD